MMSARLLDLLNAQASAEKRERLRKLATAEADIARDQPQQTRSGSERQQPLYGGGPAWIDAATRQRRDRRLRAADLDLQAPMAKRAPAINTSWPHGGPVAAAERARRERRLQAAEEDTIGVPLQVWKNRVDAWRRRCS